MRTLLFLAGVNGFLAVALGAFGAHGLKKRLLPLADGVQRLEWWQTAAHYHLAHALALGLAALVTLKVAGRLPVAAGWAFQVGILLFSGSLYAMTLSGVRALGAVTPFGGVALLVGWACVALAALRAG
jgi:uncharacterized membrane protein YgdD (TMEM256/DUF423 family)